MERSRHENSRKYHNNTRSRNNLFRLQIGGDSRLFMLEQEFKKETAQETQKSENVVRQSAEDYLKEILRKER